MHAFNFADEFEIHLRVYSGRDAGSCIQAVAELGPFQEDDFTGSEENIIDKGRLRNGYRRVFETMSWKQHGIHSLDSQLDPRLNTSLYNIRGTQ